MANQAIDAANIAALKQILATGGVGLGVGALVRGAGGLGEILSEPAAPSAAPGGPTVVTLSPTLPQKRRPNRWIQPASAPRLPPYMKQANVVPPAPTSPASPQSDMLGTAASGLYNHVIKPIGLDQMMDIPGGTTSPQAKYWQRGGQVAAAMGGVYGGSKLVDWLMGKRRQMNQDADLHAAETEYMQALQGLHSPKLAALDEARETLQKQANLSPLAQNTTNTAGFLANHWLGAAALTGIPAGYMAFNAVRSRTKPRAVQEALLMRQRLQQARRPSPIQMALPEMEAAAV